VIRFSNSVDIRREPADVFAYLGDLEHTPEWNPAITSTRRLTPGPVGVGTRYRQTRSAPRPAEEMVEVTRLEPHRWIEVVGDLGPFQAHLTYELSRTATGTRLTNSVELEPSGLSRLVGGLFTGRIQASVSENLSVLKALLEEQGAAHTR